jgi:S1-C subfamily serine protease
VITAVDTGSPVSEAGLRIGDVIVRYGHTAPPTTSMLMRAIVETRSVPPPCVVRARRGIGFVRPNQGRCAEPKSQRFGAPLIPASSP